MKKVISLLSLILAMFIFVSCVDEGDIESALAGSPCETSDTFKCDGDILLKCEDYVWEKFKFCSGKRCDASKGICEETDENSGENDADTGDQGNNPGGNQGDNGDSGTSPAPNPGDDNTDTGSNPNPNPGDDNGDTGNGNDPADTGDTGDTGYQPPDNGDTGNQQQECTGLSIDWNSFVLFEDGKYYADVNFGNPSEEDDFSIEFRHNADGSVNAGTYNLGAGDNKNYRDCKECVRAYQDYLSSNAKDFFQRSGTLKITKGGTAGNIEGTVSAILEEVTINESTNMSTKVNNGECLEIEGSFKISSGGNDNPGDDTTGCTEITLGSNLSYNHYDGYDSYETSYSPNTGSSTADTFAFELYTFTDVVWEYELENTNYDDVDIALIVYEDVQGDTCQKYYFQREGTVDITSYNASTHKIKATLSGVILEEVTINSSWHSTPVTNGKCLKIKNTTISY